MLPRVEGGGMLPRPEGGAMLPRVDGGGMVPRPAVDAGGRPGCCELGDGVTGGGPAGGGIVGRKARRAMRGSYPYGGGEGQS